MQSDNVWWRPSFLWLALVSTSAIACNPGAIEPNGVPVDSILVTPRTASVQIGSSVSLTAAALDASGEVLPSASVTWASEDDAIALVSDDGIVTGRNAGTVRIAASSWGKNAVAIVTVNPTITVFPEVGKIVIAPANPRINEGQSIQLTASVLDVDNHVITGLTITWSSSNTNRATVDATGLVRGVSSGTANISAAAGGKTASTTVRVDR